MQLQLIASLAIKLAAFLAVGSIAKDFPIKIVGRLAAADYTVAKDLSLPTMPQFTVDVEYMDAVSVHKPLPPEEMWLMLDIKQRGSQQIGLCISLNARCEVIYDEKKNELLVRGEEFDMDGLMNYDRVLLVKKPEGYG